MSEQERPRTAGREPYERHQRSKSSLVRFENGVPVNKCDADGKPIAPSAAWEKFMAETPEASKVNWNAEASFPLPDKLRNPHKRNRSSESRPEDVPTKKQRKVSLQSLAGSIRKIYRRESPIDRTLWEPSDYVVETNHLFDRTVAVISEFRYPNLQEHPAYGHAYCVAELEYISKLAVIHDGLYGPPKERDILRQMELNDEVYRKEGGVQEKAVAFYNVFLKAFNQFVEYILLFDADMTEDILRFNTDMPDDSISKDVEKGIPFWDKFADKLDNMGDELSALAEAVQKFKGEVPPLPKPEEAKKKDHDSPSTEEWGEPGPAYKDGRPQGVTSD
ncbi:hypothetical protein GE21DRAFT_4136 [Neurospora crassa]|uniref:Uncharacterized protein n=1 Tax=Neurospora crassa (strain ATCC 24698 / 74-OR23-1A / CBS 708.71 / DSM 1257 / FGSC 987) TaxID=367110 RepID=Q7RYG8_NEUCR|nr:hypothetical protein NCU06507 [Neurospora crassa OR74A]EAA27911.1 hypothetical protein NCU06507 [Neurospora crassa OR74A]KHE85510.1 hypothetical protein GE21DRAFT_4136 [Neurospora crassa]|eukprot:XP_957147.1 hypothetical protein NCU06507 [Neurospora crassa OR74A]